MKRKWTKRRRQPSADCRLDECRFYDPDVDQYGYAVACIAGHACGYYRLMFMCDDNSPLGRRRSSLNRSGATP